MITFFKKFCLTTIFSVVVCVIFIFHFNILNLSYDIKNEENLPSVNMMSSFSEVKPDNFDAEVVLNVYEGATANFTNNFIEITHPNLFRIDDGSLYSDENFTNDSDILDINLSSWIFYYVDDLANDTRIYIGHNVLDQSKMNISYYPITYLAISCVNDKYILTIENQFDQPKLSYDCFSFEITSEQFSIIKKKSASFGTASITDFTKDIYLKLFTSIEDKILYYNVQKNVITLQSKIFTS